jgi:magnesium-transporting ATPase (P-type)
MLSNNKHVEIGFPPCFLFCIFFCFVCVFHDLLILLLLFLSLIFYFIVSIFILLFFALSYLNVDNHPVESPRNEIIKKRILISLMSTAAFNIVNFNAPANQLHILLWRMEHGKKKNLV